MKGGAMSARTNDDVTTTLADLRALCKRATPGPWIDDKTFGGVRASDRVVVQSWDKYEETFSNATANRAFIAAARTWLPALIEVAEAARALTASYEEAPPYERTSEENDLCAALAWLDEVGKP